LKKEVKKELFAVVLLIALLVAFACASSSLLMPKRENFGSTWGRFLKEEKDSVNVLFFGSSMSYCDIVPPVIWEKSGLTSYVMAGPEQTIPITYYYVSEALKTQKPKALFIEVTGVFFEKYQNYTKVNIGYMPWDENRIGATLSASESKEIIGLLFPLYNYHSRWDSLEREDFRIALKGYSADELAGYTFLADAKEMASVQPRNESFDGANYNTNIGYLKKIAELCEKNGIKPVYYIAPNYWPLSDEHMSMLENDIGKMGNVRFIDFNKDGGLSSYDPKLDFYDNLHFNWRGAEKFSDRLADILTRQLGLEPTVNPDSTIWNTRAQDFHKLCAG